MRRGGRGEEQMTKRCGLGQETGTAKWLNHTEARQAGVGKPNIIPGLESLQEQVCQPGRSCDEKKLRNAEGPLQTASTLKC